MRRLVIHLGLPKTATTSLQTHIFPHLSGYLGRFHEPEPFPSAALAKLRDLFLSKAPTDNEQVFDIDGRPVWFPAMQDWVAELVSSNEDILLLSEEGLSTLVLISEQSHRSPDIETVNDLARRRSYPIVRFLKQLRDLVPQNIELKTILTLRNQSDWLISNAAQQGITNTGFVEQLIHNDDPVLNYYAITEDLERLRGPEHHLTLLFENGLEHNVQEILQFAGYSPAHFPNLQMSQSRANVRRSKSGWTVYGTGFERLERPISALRSSSPLLDKHLRTNQSLRRLLRPFLGYEARKRALGKIPALTKGINISLTQEQRTAIKSHCEPSNARLSAHLDVDLKALGY